MLAAQRGHFETSQALLKYGADASIQDQEESTALHYSASGGNLKLTKLIIQARADFNDLDMNVRGFDGRSPLHEAALRDHADMVLLLLSNGASIEAEDDSGRTALVSAAMIRCLDAVKALLNRVANVSAYVSKNGVMMSPICLAAEYGSVSSVAILLDEGVNIEERDHKGATALLAATHDYGVAVVKLLLERGADIEARDSFLRTPLILAAKTQKSKAVDFLLEQAKDESGRTALIWGIPAYHEYYKPTGEDAVSCLLAHGANVNATDNYGNTPLSLAIKKGFKTIQLLLIEAGALPAASAIDTGGNETTSSSLTNSEI